MKIQGIILVALVTCVLAFGGMINSSSAIIEKADGDFKITIKAFCDPVKVSILWDAVSGAESYYVYRSLDSEELSQYPMTDYPIQETKFVDSNVDFAQIYKYYVTALDSKLKILATSGERSISTATLTIKFTQDSKKYWKNNEENTMDVAAMNKWDRLFVPIRALAENVCWDVNWEADEKKSL